VSVTAFVALQIEPPSPTESVLLDITVIAALVVAIVVGLFALRNRRR
jgi:hypothetical protein